MNQNRFAMVGLIAGIVLAFSGLAVVHAASPPVLGNQSNDTGGDSIGANSHVDNCPGKQLQLGAIQADRYDLRAHFYVIGQWIAEVHRKDPELFRRELGKALQSSHFNLVESPANGCPLLVGTIDHYFKNPVFPDAPYRAEIWITEASGQEVCRVAREIEGGKGIYFSAKSLWVNKLVKSVLAGIEIDCWGYWKGRDLPPKN